MTRTISDPLNHIPNYCGCCYKRAQVSTYSFSLKSGGTLKGIGVTIMIHGGKGLSTIFA